LHGSEANQLGVAEESSGAVVVGVKEGQGLLLEDQEDGVQEFDIFVDVVELRRKKMMLAFWGSIGWGIAIAIGKTYVVQNDEGLSPSTVVVADGVEDAVAHQGGQKLLHEQSQKNGADSGEKEVVNHEESVELEGR
jgi:hypothetical protein